MIRNKSSSSSLDVYFARQYFVFFAKKIELMKWATSSGLFVVGIFNLEIAIENGEVEKFCCDWKLQ